MHGIQSNYSNNKTIAVKVLTKKIKIKFKCTLNFVIPNLSFVPCLNAMYLLLFFKSKSHTHQCFVFQIPQVGAVARILSIN